MAKNKGTTLVEVMLAIVILLIVTLGTGAFLYYSAIGIVTENNKRVALESANSRLEDMRAANYADMKPLDSDVHFIKKVGGSWQRDGADDETVMINGISFPITTTVQYIEDDYIYAVVRVGYKLNSSQRVTLETYIGTKY